MEPNITEASKHLAESTGVSACLCEFLRLRGYDTPEKVHFFLKGNLADLGDPLVMKGAKEACARIRKAVQDKEKILIHGDYDVDGITGAAILARTLDLLKADFQVFLPERSEDGYGVSERAISAASRQGVSLLITVDCGIAAFWEIQKARDAGMEVIVVDHHKIPFEGLPPATVILNPLQEDCAYPFKDLSAAGLAFQLSRAILGERSLQFLDLAALSTVCDLAPLTGENRILVKEGLKLLSARTHLGLACLGDAAGLTSERVNAGHLGFILGPRLNAAGRMGNPDISLRLLMTDHRKEAEALAAALQEENKARQAEEKQTLKAAIREAERTVNFNRDRILVVAGEGWHPGVVGIVASRLVERYGRPAMVIAWQKGKGKGSGRSIKGFDLYQALAACRDLLEEFGGHEQAGGLSMREENFQAFKEQISGYAGRNLSPDLLEKTVRTDMEISLGDLTPSFIRELDLLEPYGIGNPRPVFRTEKLRVKTKPARVSPRTIQFFVTDGTWVYEAAWYDPAAGFAGPGTRSGAEGLSQGMTVDLAYTVKSKNFLGQERVILETKEIKPRL